MLCKIAKAAQFSLFQSKEQLLEGYEIQAQADFRERSQSTNKWRQDKEKKQKQEKINLDFI